MFQGFLVAAALFGSELAGALIELCGHLSRLFSRAAQRDENLSELRRFHGLILAGSLALNTD